MRSRIARHGSWLIGVVAAMAVAATAGAATHVVNPEGTGDYPTIQAAVDAASYGDTIELTDGTFTGPGNRDIVVSEDLTIRAQNGPTGYCIIDCEASQSDQHFGIEIDDNGGGARLEGFTIQNAWVYDFGGALHALTEAVITIDSCIFWNNYAELGGGAIEATTGCEITINSCFFAGNRTNQGGPGGAIYADDAVDIQINDCGFNGNWGDGGGALYLSYNDATLTNCTINGSDGYGAALHADNYSSLWVYNTIISFGDVAAVRCTGSAGVVMYCCDIYGNAGGDWTDCVMSQYDVNGNISEDPLFCWPYGTPFGLAENSPCAAENNPACGLIGAYDVDCGPAIYAVQADGLGEYPTIQDAIDAAAEGSIVELADGVYMGDGNRDLDFGGKILTVRSASGNPSSCVIDCEGGPGDEHRAFYFDNAEPPECTIADIKITGGYGESVAAYGGAVRCGRFTSPTFSNVSFYVNSVVSGALRGGAVHADSASAPTFIGCSFIGNEALNGGALSTDAADVTMTDCTIQANSTTYDWGGGLWLGRGSATFTGCTFSSNQAMVASIGGAGVLFYGEYSFTDCDFISNTSSDAGGALALFATNPIFTNCTFNYNRATGTAGSAPRGGALVILDESSPSFHDCAFAYNEAEKGGAIYSNTSDVTLEGCTFENNWVSGDVPFAGALGIEDGIGSVTGCTFLTNVGGQHGGAIAGLSSCFVFVDDCEFVGNSADWGAAVSLASTATGEVTNCSFADNTSIANGGAFYTASPDASVQGCLFTNNHGGWGGAIQCLSGICDVSGSTFIGNTATSYGGAIHSSLCAVSITACTLVGNSAPDGSGLYYTSSPDLSVENTIIAFGTGGSAVGLFGDAPSFTCTDIFGNTGGDWTEDIADQLGLNGNICQDPHFCGAENPDEPYTLYEDSPCAPEYNPACGLIGAHDVGCSSGSDVEWDGAPAVQIGLSSAYPNPAVDRVHMSYVIPDHAAGVPVKLLVVDSQGRLMRILANDNSIRGVGEVSWDGRDQRGRRVDAGIYYCHLRIGDEHTNQRIVMAR